MAERWVTFDCYGTLVDWNGGIRHELESLFGVEHADRLLARYHELEPEIQAASPGSSYREVLTVALERLADETGLTLPEGEANALARSLPSWPVFDDVRPALAEARERGWRLAILSNTDRDLVDASMKAIGVPFGAAIVAGEIGSYKPAHRHWEAFREHTRVAREGHVHVAQSVFHDIAPAAELGIPTIWINRLGEPDDSRPKRTLPSLTGLADALADVAAGVSITAAIRQATATDSARITEHLNAIARDHYGTTELTEEEVGAWFAHDELEVLLAERDGRVVGYGDRWREAERDRAWLEVAVRSEDSSTAEALLRELEQRAHPDVDPGALAMTYVADVDETMREAVEGAGYVLIRHSFRMAISLDDALASPDWPTGIRVATYEAEHESAVHAAHQEAFADHWEHKDEPLAEWRKWLVENPSFDPSFWFIAWDGAEIAGLSLCRIHASGDIEHGFVSVLAVRRPWRRRGLGTALLQHSFLEMRGRGMRKASLGVDGENTTGAVRLYEQAGMNVERRYDCYRKEL